jgi:hypothetical protein
MSEPFVAEPKAYYSGARKLLGGLLRLSTTVCRGAFGLAWKIQIHPSDDLLYS